MQIKQLILIKQQESKESKAGGSKKNKDCVKGNNNEDDALQQLDQHRLEKVREYEYLTEQIKEMKHQLAAAEREKEQQSHQDRHSDRHSNHHHHHHNHHHTPSQSVARLLEVAEDKAADLATKNSALAEELIAYQAYMKATVLQYKKQVQFLKKQVASLRKAKDSDSCTPTQIGDDIVVADEGTATPGALVGSSSERSVANVVGEKRAELGGGDPLKLPVIKDAVAI